MIKTIRSYLDTWEGLPAGPPGVVDHLRAAHKVSPCCTEAGPPSPDRRHWEAHGSELARFLDAHRSRREDRQPPGASRAGVLATRTEQHALTCYRCSS